MRGLDKGFYGIGESESSEDEDEESDNEHNEIFFRRWISHFKTFNITQEGKINDSKCGYIYYLLVAIIIVVTIFAYFNELTVPEVYITGYLEGKTYSYYNSNLKLWEVKDTLIPGYPKEQVFVPTVIRATMNQKQSVCESPTNPCKQDSDCNNMMKYLYSTGTTGKTVTEIYGEAKCSNNMCMLQQWCPAHYNKTYQEHILEGVTEQVVVIKGKVIKDDEVKDKDDREERRYFPNKDANVIKVKDILLLAGVSDYKIVQGNGAIILLHLSWECFKNKDDDSCRKGISARRVDKTKNEGYFVKKLNYKQSVDSSGAAANIRDELRMTGIQIFLMLDANQYKLSLFYILFSVMATEGLIYFVRILMLWLVMTCSSDAYQFNEIKYEEEI